MGYYQQLVRFVLTRKKLVVFVGVLYLIGFFKAYAYYSGHRIIESTNRGGLVYSMFDGLLSDRWSSSGQHLDADEDAGLFSLSSSQNDFHHVHDGTIVIAVGGGITSKGSSIPARLAHVNETVLLDLEFFKTLFLSFCRTAENSTKRYHYRFYLGYDQDDPLFTDRHATEVFRRTFDAETARLCRPRSVEPSMKLVACRHSGRPAWAQNDAMLDAYLDGVDYFYRVNDDTRMLTGGWTRKFIQVLTRYDPPLVGVVGPRHYGGNTGILTYDFVHRTHVEVFGFYYPRVFGDWYGDGWITRVYQPDRSTKLEQVRLAHTMALGRRYQLLVHEAGRKLSSRVFHDKIVLQRYVSAVRAGLKLKSFSLTSSSSPGVSSARRVFVVLLNNSEPRSIWGVIRNAQLIRVYLPDWKLRVLIPSTLHHSLPYESPTASSFQTSSEPNSSFRRSISTPTVEKRFVDTLRRLGADVVSMNITTSGRLTPLLNAVLVDPEIDFMLFRRPDWRLGEKEAVAILDWVKAAERGGPDYAVVHCIHDDIVHSRSALVDDLWGCRPAAFRRRLIAGGTPETVLRLGDDAGSFLDVHVWPHVADVAYCHDSVNTCHGGRPPGITLPFSAGALRDDGFIGQSHDENHEPISADTNVGQTSPCSNQSVSFGEQTKAVEARTEATRHE